MNTIIKLWHSQLKLILCKYIRHLVFMLKLAILSFFLYAHAILLLVARSYTCKNCILRGFMYFFYLFFFFSPTGQSLQLNIVLNVDLVAM